MENLEHWILIYSFVKVNDFLFSGPFSSMTFPPNILYTCHSTLSWKSDKSSL